jgi:hypothetical protein
MALLGRLLGRSSRHRGRPRDASASDEIQEMVEGPQRMQSLPIERVCFICLDDNHAEDDRLLPSCTRCCAMVHQSCWSNWRLSQSSHARRSRVSGIWSGSDPFLCSICKSGAARLEREIVSSRWLESFIDVNRSAYSYNRNSSGLFLALSRARNREDEDEETENDDEIGDFFSISPFSFSSSLFTTQSLPVLALFVSILSIFAQVVIWKVFDLDTQLLVLSLTVTVCSTIGTVASAVLFEYQRKKYNNFITV